MKFLSMGFVLGGCMLFMAGGTFANNQSSDQDVPSIPSIQGSPSKNEPLPVQGQSSISDQQSGQPVASEPSAAEPVPVPAMPFTPSFYMPIPEPSKVPEAFEQVQMVLQDKPELEGMVGKQPKLFYWLLREFKRTTRRSSIFLNRLLLYGPPGNGKTTLARKFADSTGSLFVARSACSMVERYVGQGATNVVEMFNKARELSQQTGKRVVILIDEIDALAASNATEFRAEHKAALQQLWIELDSCKHDPMIFVMFATNEFKKLSKTFLDRFGCNTIEIKNPDAAMRKQVLEHYLQKTELVLDAALLAKLVTKTKDLSNRSLEDMVNAIKMTADLEHNGQVTEEMVWDTLAQIKKKFDGNTSDQDDKRETPLQRATNIVSIISGSLGSLLNAYTLTTIVAAAIGIKMGMQSHDQLAQAVSQGVTNAMAPYMLARGAVTAH